MKLLLRIEEHYGRQRFFPHNDLAKKICKLIGQKTIVAKKFRYLTDLGYQIEFTREHAPIKISDFKYLTYPKENKK